MARNPRVSPDAPGGPTHTEFGGAPDYPIQPAPHEPDAREKLMMIYATGRDPEQAVIDGYDLPQLG